mgnify:FL=1
MRIKILSLLTASLFLTQTSFSKTATMAEQSSFLQTEIEFNTVSQNSSTEAITNKENLAAA